MKQSLFKRIIVLYVAILFLAVLGSEIFLTRAVRTSSINTLRNDLIIQASLISRGLPFPAGMPLDEHCRQLKEVTGARVTVIAPDGTVRGDSDTSSARMDNHAGRIEIRQADLLGTGMAVRRSDTLNADLLYVALKIGRGGAPAGFVRLSLPLTRVDASVRSLRVTVLLIVFVILLATGGFSLLQLDRLRRLTVQVRDFATSVANGDFGKRLFLSGAGEFDDIAASLNAMAEELQQVLAAGEEEKKRLSIILRNIPDALLIIDFWGVVQLGSSASHRFFGHASIKGKPFVEVVRAPEFLGLIESVRKDLAPGVIELRLEHPEERDCVVRVSPLFYRENELAGFIALFHDVTRLKRLERTRTDFVANLSHEIRTPVTAISGFAETLLDGALEDRENARRFVSTIKANSDRITSLVDDLMTISKLELGVIKVQKRTLVFGEAAESVLALLRERANAKGLVLSVVPAAAAGTMQADRDRLIQILTNLVDNAIKFTEQGSVTFGLRSEEGRTVLFVEDTGIGIPEKHLPRLGERFYRVDAARSREAGGTGLGLAIVKHLVKAHGWEMEIRSAEGKGTTVRIYV